jgi:hypothetical protein
MSLAELETSIPALVQSSSTDGTVPVLFRHTTHLATVLDLPTGTGSKIYPQTMC